MEEGSIFSLPYEILENVLSSEILDHNDVRNFQQVCKEFESVCCSNLVWKRKFIQRYPRLRNMPEVFHLLQQPLSAINWKDEFSYRQSYGEQVCQYVKNMSPRYIQMDDLSKKLFDEYKLLVDKCQLGFQYVTDVLFDILEDGNKHKNLTEKYYAEKILAHIQVYRLYKLFHELFNLPGEQQPLELGAIYIAQWCQPTTIINRTEVTSQLYDIACRVREVVCLTYPDHPMNRNNYQVPHNEPPLAESLWKPGDCRQVLICMARVMFGEMGVLGDCSYESLVVEKSYINKVLETKVGIPIILCVIYYSVAKRVGVKCDLVNFPCHFLLRWKEFPSVPEYEQYTYIDACNGGAFLTEDQCKKLVPAFRIGEDSFSIATPRQVFERMSRNLVGVHDPNREQESSEATIRLSLELLTFLNPNDSDSMLNLFRQYMHNRINLEEVVERLESMEGTDEHGMPLYMLQASRLMATMEDMNNASHEIIPKLRSRTSKKSRIQPLEFAVGMIMKHKRYNYYCVINGWDMKCEASQEWIRQMRVNNLPYKHNQPFYNVLVDDSSIRYAAQENLEIADGIVTIPHPNIGRYFEEYCGKYYKPNQELETEYPEDTPIRNNLLQID